MRKHNWCKRSDAELVYETLKYGSSGDVCNRCKFQCTALSNDHMLCVGRDYYWIEEKENLPMTKHYCVDCNKNSAKIVAKVSTSQYAYRSFYSGSLYEHGKKLYHVLMCDCCKKKWLLKIKQQQPQKPINKNNSNTKYVGEKRGLIAK